MRSEQTQTGTKLVRVHVRSFGLGDLEPPSSPLSPKQQKEQRGNCCGRVVSSHGATAATVGYQIVSAAASGALCCFGHCIPGNPFFLAGITVAVGQGCCLFGCRVGGINAQQRFKLELDRLGEEISSLTGETVLLEKVEKRFKKKLGKYRLVMSETFTQFSEFQKSLRRSGIKTEDYFKELKKNLDFIVGSQIRIFENMLKSNEFRGKIANPNLLEEEEKEKFFSQIQGIVEARKKGTQELTDNIQYIKTFIELHGLLENVFNKLISRVKSLEVLILEIKSKKEELEKKLVELERVQKQENENLEKVQSSLKELIAEEKKLKESLKNAQRVKEAEHRALKLVALLSQALGGEEEVVLFAQDCLKKLKKRKQDLGLPAEKSEETIDTNSEEAALEEETATTTISTEKAS